MILNLEWWDYYIWIGDSKICEYGEVVIKFLYNECYKSLFYVYIEMNFEEKMIFGFFIIIL